jgi:hypothetical protein
MFPPPHKPLSPVEKFLRLLFLSLDVVCRLETRASNGAPSLLNAEWVIIREGGNYPSSSAQRSVRAGRYRRSVCVRACVRARARVYVSVIIPCFRISNGFVMAASANVKTNFLCTKTLPTAQASRQSPIYYTSSSVRQVCCGKRKVLTPLFFPPSARYCQRAWLE